MNCTLITVSSFVSAFHVVIVCPCQIYIHILIVFANTTSSGKVTHTVQSIRAIDYIGISNTHKHTHALDPFINCIISGRNQIVLLVVMC